MKHRLPWQRVWVTGAGRGIGKAVSRLLAEQGVTVYASSRNHEELGELRQSCSNLRGSILPCPMDICNQQQVADYLDQWDRDNLMPDLVILNAGTHQPTPAKQFDVETCCRILQVNLHGTINCLAPILNRFQAGGRGQVAIMASVAGYRGLPTAGAYGASKAALINLCEALRLDLAGSGVKLQVINPGFVRTPLTDLNEFTMPALMEPEAAAVRIVQGLQQNRFEITFPRRFVYVMKLLRLLPYTWYFKLIGSTVTPESKGEQGGNR